MLSGGGELLLRYLKVQRLAAAGADRVAVQQARLALCIGVKNVIFNALTMFKINVPEKM